MHTHQSTLIQFGNKFYIHQTTYRIWLAVNDGHIMPIYLYTMEHRINVRSTERVVRRNMYLVQMVMRYSCFLFVIR